MNYRSFADLDSCVVRNLWKLPPEVDLIVGIPRSGMLLATLLALHLNIPFTDLQGFLEGRILSSGRRAIRDGTRPDFSPRLVAIVDDSVCNGNEMVRARALLKASGRTEKVIFVTAYALEKALQHVDTYFEICPVPRIFAWNLMHNDILASACVDIDGVLCLDPTDDQNDDGPCYVDFLQNAKPLFRPTHQIANLVTCRLEKYREHTEKWLRQNGISYRKLTMWDLPDKRARLAAGGHGAFKAEVYRSLPEAEIFIESARGQAIEIANLALKPVICVETQSVHWPGKKQLVAGAIRNTPRWSKRVVNRVFNSARDYLVRLSQP